MCLQTHILYTIIYQLFIIIIHSFIYSFIHSFIYSTIYSLTHSLIHSFNVFFFLFIYLFIYLLICFLCFFMHRITLDIVCEASTKSTKDTRLCLTITGTEKIKVKCSMLLTNISVCRWIWDFHVQNNTILLSSTKHLQNQYRVKTQNILYNDSNYTIFSLTRRALVMTNTVFKLVFKSWVKELTQRIFFFKRTAYYDWTVNERK
jgi:hypothetical protein